MLLAFTSTIFLILKPCGTHDYNLDSQSPLLISPKNKWPSYTSRYWIPFSSPLTRRAMVDVFIPEDGCHRKLLFHCCVLIAEETTCPHVPSNSCCTASSLQRCYLAIGLIILIRVFTLPLYRYISIIKIAKVHLSTLFFLNSVYNEKIGKDKSCSS